jgi:hypothetical protein
MDTAKTTGSLSPPKTLLNASNSLMKGLVYGKTTHTTMIVLMPFQDRIVFQMRCSVLSYNTIMSVALNGK